MPNRRQFIQLTATGAAAALMSRNIFADDTSVNKKNHSRAFQLALASYSLHKIPFDQALEMTQRVGLKHICLNPIHLPVSSSREQIEQALAKLKAAGLDLYASGVVQMHTPDEVQRAFEFAKTAALRVIVAVPAPDVLPLVNEKVQQYDIRVAIHNHGPEDKLYPTPLDAYKKIRSLDPRVGLCHDIGHTLRAGVDPCEATVKCADRLLDVHIKDINQAAPTGHGVEVGRGVIDIPKFLDTLERIGYSGMVSFENEKDPQNPLPGLAESVGYVRGVLAAKDSCTG